MKRAVVCAALVACSHAAAPVPADPPRAMIEQPAALDGVEAPPPDDGDDGGDDEVAAAPATPIADQYREVAGKIIAAARADRGAYQKLAYLTDHIGNRISGSRQLDQAIAWASSAMKADGHDVHTEPVMVPHWVRGAERAAITSPIQRDLVVIGLGMTVGTRKGGVTGKVVVIHDWAELEARKDQVKGAIVLYDVAMPAYDEQTYDSHYGDVVPYRWAGPAAAGKLGAAAVLMRSVTAHSLRTAHTGALDKDGVPKVPSAAVTVEDAELLARLAAEGDVTVHLELGARTLPDVPSANVIGELRGRELPDEVVVIGGHLDSWDVGQGAHDDGAGVVHVMEALTVLRQLGLQPRRTIRVVLFTNEENGGRGGQGYAKAHAAEVAKHVAMIETDGGGFAPRGFELKVGGGAAEAALAKATDIATLLAPLDATTVKGGEHAGSDIEPMVGLGVAGLGLDVRGKTYFDIHHTQADTLDKVDPAALADGVAAIAVMAYVLADMPDRLQ